MYASTKKAAIACNDIKKMNQFHSNTHVQILSSIHTTFVFQKKAAEEEIAEITCNILFPLSIPPLPATEWSTPPYLHPSQARKVFT
jgi:hypothetical protein